MYHPVVSCIILNLTVLYCIILSYIGVLHYIVIVYNIILYNIVVAYSIIWDIALYEIKLLDMRNRQHGTGCFEPLLMFWYVWETLQGLHEFLKGIVHLFVVLNWRTARRLVSLERRSSHLWCKSNEGNRVLAPLPVRSATDTKMSFLAFVANLQKHHTFTVRLWQTCVPCALWQKS